MRDVKPHKLKPGTHIVFMDNDMIHHWKLEHKSELSWWILEEHEQFMWDIGTGKGVGFMSLPREVFESAQDVEIVAASAFFVGGKREALQAVNRIKALRNLTC